MQFNTLTGFGKTWLLVAGIIGCLLSATGYTSNSHEPKTHKILTLETAIEKTLAQNPQLYQYTFVNQALKANLKTQALRPLLALELESENFGGSGEYGGFDSAETTLSLSSVIELGGKRNARVNLSDAKLNSAKWQQQAETLDVLGELTRLYIEGLATQANIELAEDSLHLAESLLKTVKTRAARGATPEAEVLRAQAAVTQEVSRLAALTSKLERQKIKLTRYWAETTPQFGELSGSLFEFGKTESFEQLYTRIEASPSLQIFTSEARVKDAEVTLARTSGRSDITWRVGIKRFEETGDSALAAGVSIPLFSKKRSSASVRSALAERNAIDYARQDALLRLRVKLFEAYSLRQQNIEAVTRTRHTVIPALVKALRLTRKAYENGRYRYQDIVAAQEELLNARQMLIDAATNALISQAIIEQLISEALTH